jgi:phage N-6-adenine-methyltransferase
VSDDRDRPRLFLDLGSLRLTEAHAEAVAVGEHKDEIFEIIRQWCIEELPALRGETFVMPPPKQKPGLSRQDYQTPPEFLEAVKSRLGIRAFAIDLAASAENTAASRFYSEADDSLKQPWTVGGWGWLNPPFARIEPWVQRAYDQSRIGARVAVLVPAGVGSNWWRDWVHGKALALMLNGRITFVGEPTCYPKDCCLLLYAPYVAPGYDVWSWPEQPKVVAA